MASKFPELNAPSAEHLKQVFETAVVGIGQNEVMRRRMPIVQRQRSAATLTSPENTDKRAVSDAARALAQLWKISPSHAR